MSVTASQPNVIAVSALTKSYEQLVAVDQLSLELKKGESLAILGPNGAGKTTLLEMIEGLQDPDSGSIEIFGMPLKQNRNAILRRVGAVLQDSNLYKRMTIKETWELFASFFPNSLDVATLAEQMGLQDKLNVQLRKLSGGERQRAYLGTALVGRPEILFLDEPTTGLDPHARRKIWHLVQALQAAGISMILTTHYMEEAAHLAHRVVIMFKGKIVVSGEPKALVREHCGTDVVEVAAADGDVLQKIAEKFAKKHSLQRDLGNLSLFCDSLEHAMTIAKLATDVADSARTSLQSLQVRRATLEDVFMFKTGSSLDAG